MTNIRWLSVIVLSIALSGAVMAGPGRGGGGRGGGGGGAHVGGGGAHFGGGGAHFGGGGAHFGVARVGGGGAHFAGARAGGFRGGGGHFAGRAAHVGGGRASISHATRGGAAVSHASRGGNVANATRGGNVGANRALAERGGNFGHNSTLAGRNGGTLSRHAAVRANAVHSALAGAAVAGALHNHNALNNPGNRANISAAAARAGWHGRGGGWWRHGNGGYGWVGPLFWPFAYYDLYDYALWGWGPAFWDYGYGDIYAGIFAPYGYDDLAGYLPYGGGYGYRYGGGAAPSSATGNATTSGPNEVAQMCGEDTQDVAGLPIDRIQQELQLNDQQKTALDSLADASLKASQTIKDACPTQVASTAPGRLVAMQNRIEAMITAVNIVEPALDHFYGLLNDEQKARLTALGQDKVRGNKNDILAQGCGNGQPGQTDWPSAEIERRIHPSEAQQASLNNLKDATARAQDMLKDTCQPNQPLTPPARLDAEAKRLNAMLQAVETVKSALDDLYSELSDEQKAQFESIGPGRGSFASGSVDESAPASARHHHRRHYGRHYVSVGGLVRRLIGF